MIFAAGFGTRMGALTANRPKPLIPIAGKALLDHALDLADAAGVGTVVVNSHYLAAQIAQHLTGRKVQISEENDQILETGGGLRKALPSLGEGPVMTLNSDAVWTGQNPLAQLAAEWDDARMDALLLLLPTEKATGHAGTGDFILGSDGRIVRAAGQPGMVYLGAQIIRPDGLAAIDKHAFSLNLLWDDMIARSRAFGIVHHGGWCDVGRPEGISEAETLLAGQHV